LPWRLLPATPVGALLQRLNSIVCPKDMAKNGQSGGTVQPLREMRAILPEW
jgi:hypothetical protein